MFLGTFCFCLLRYLSLWINLDSSGNPKAGKLFNYKIKYNNPDPITATVIGRFNGNIAKIDWWVVLQKDTVINMMD